MARSESAHPPRHRSSVSQEGEMLLVHPSALAARPPALPQVGQEVGGSETSQRGPEDSPGLQGVEALFEVLIGTLDCGSGLGPSSPGWPQPHHSGTTRLVASEFINLIPILHSSDPHNNPGR